MNSISQSSSPATPVNLTQMLYSAFASIVFRMAFGKSFQGSDFHNERCYNARIERAFLELDTLFQQVIDDHLKAERKERKEDVINVLLKMERDQTESSAPQLTKDNIEAVILLSYEPFPSKATENEQMKGYCQFFVYPI
ncbi:hypothetical protein POTOM_032177 [Populus tomentosa]|uniref:Uncharacterized protein n=1 Tax=Populus tomentosa TaxID=118781 RepID=A0A8X7Z8P7_POPTO|nr:hypothetical protein POTOM_032177 [Populus tomentosa]